MPALTEFYDLLFEISNEHRHGILLLLQKRAMRVTDMKKEMDINNPEIRRHISRLRDVDLINRDSDGFYHLTPYGETTLLFCREIQFLSSNSDYFKDHSSSEIPARFLKQIGELSKSSRLKNAMSFLHQMESLVKETKDHVWMIVDQFPIATLSTIVDSIGRGVEYRIIEPRERALNPELDSNTSEETRNLSQARNTSLVEQRMVDDVKIYMIVSDSRCIVGFPTSDGQFDYKGFTASDDQALTWCKELHKHYWDEAELRLTTPSMQVKRGHISGEGESGDRIVVEGRWRPDVDAQAVQDAVDNYDEVILRGTFNIGDSTIYINRSIVIRGERRENDIPITRIFKSGWKFPSYQEEFLIVVNEKDCDVTIENIHFTDFNHYCIMVHHANSVNILNNYITLYDARGRGWTRDKWGDTVFGIFIGGPDEAVGICPEGATIRGNHIDFARALSRSLDDSPDLEEPEYRPDPKNHANWHGFGIVVRLNLGRVTVEDNVIKNVTTRAISVMDNYSSSTIYVRNNKISSRIHGGYTYFDNLAGVGINVHSANLKSDSSSRVFIEGNEIELEKVNFCGIAVCGPSLYGRNLEKLEECRVIGNHIHLPNGSVGILVKENDNAQIVNNRISGSVYYGIHVTGRYRQRGSILGSFENTLTDNDMDELVIKAPDEYSNMNVDGFMFTGVEGKARTAHIWLDQYTKNNTVQLRRNQTAIDEGEDNTISYQEGTK